MSNIAADYIHRGLGGLHRRPVLTAILLLLAAFGMVVLAVGLGAASGSNSRNSGLLYVVGVTTTNHNREPSCQNYS
jgi:hypothetical protein